MDMLQNMVVFTPGLGSFELLFYLANRVTLKSKASTYAIEAEVYTQKKVCMRALPPALEVFLPIAHVHLLLSAVIF